MSNPAEGFTRASRGQHSPDWATGSGGLRSSRDPAAVMPRRKRRIEFREPRWRVLQLFEKVMPGRQREYLRVPFHAGIDESMSFPVIDRRQRFDDSIGHRITVCSTYRMASAGSSAAAFSYPARYS